MGLSNQLVKSPVYQGDGANKNFAIPFATIKSKPDYIEVYTIDPDDTMTLTVAYTLSPDSVSPTEVVMNAAPNANTRVIIIREMPYVQIFTFLNSGPWQAEDYETALNFLTMLTQQLAEKLERAPQLSVLTTSGTPELPEPDDGKALVWDGGDLKNSAVDLTQIEADVADIDADVAAAEQAKTDAVIAQIAAEDAQAATQSIYDDVVALVGSILLQTMHSFTQGQAATDLEDEIFDGSSYDACDVQLLIKRGTIMYRSNWNCFFDGTDWIAKPSISNPADDSMGEHGITLSFGAGTNGQLKLAATAGDDGEVTVKKTFYANA